MKLTVTNVIPQHIKYYPCKLSIIISESNALTLKLSPVAVKNFVAKFLDITSHILNLFYIYNYLTEEMLLILRYNIALSLTSSVGFNSTLSGTDQFLISFLNLNGFNAAS